MIYHLHAAVAAHQVAPGSYSDAALIGTDGGRARTGRRNGQLGAFPTYCRWASPQSFTPPFTVHGSMLVRSRLDEVWIEHENRAPTWDWRLCVLAFRDEDNNVVATFGGRDQPSLPGLSYQRNKLYGTKDPQWPGWATPLARERTAVPMGRWFHWAFDVDETTYRLHVDGRLVLAGTFAEPVIAAPLKVGLRLDFHDVELADTYVEVSHGEIKHEEEHMKVWIGRAPDGVKVLAGGRAGVTHIKSMQEYNVHRVNGGPDGVGPRAVTIAGDELPERLDNLPIGDAATWRTFGVDLGAV